MLKSIYCWILTKWMLITFKYPRIYRFIRWFQGAKKVKKSSDTKGIYRSNDAYVNFGGACPVEGIGEIDGHGIYYRSRGEGWSLEIYEDTIDIAEENVSGDVIWEYGESRYYWPDGGWVSAEVSFANIDKALKLFQKEYKK